MILVVGCLHQCKTNTNAFLKADLIIILILDARNEPTKNYHHRFWRGLQFASSNTGQAAEQLLKQRKHVFIRLINEMTFTDTVATLLEILYRCCFRTLFKPKRSKKKKRLQLFRDIENMQPCHIGYDAVFILTFMKTEMILSGVSAPCVCWNISVLYLTFRAEVSERRDVVKGLRLNETTSYLRNL